MLTLISFILLVVGGINWLCIGIVQFDLIAGIFGSQANIFSRLIYILVGLATIWMIVCAIKTKGQLSIKHDFFSRKKSKPETSLEKDMLGDDKN